MALPSYCPLCNIDNNKQSVVTQHVYGDENQNHAFYKCLSCSIIYLYPQLNEEQERIFYAKEFEGFMNDRSGEKSGWINPEKHVDANKAQYERRYNYLKNYLPKTGSILEYGCSSGFMLYPLRDLGYQCFGIEPSDYFSKFLKNNEIIVYDSLSDLTEQFDIIMHYFVLEHVRNPREFISSNLLYLKKGGKLIIEIPNASDPLYTIYNIPEFEKFYWSIAHHWYFNEHSFTYLLEQIPGIKFHLLKDQRYDFSNHMIWARDGKPGGMNRFSKYFSPNFEASYKNALIDSGNCDTLIAIIEKE